MKKLLLAIALVVAFPMAAYAAHQFSDVPEDHIFHDEIARQAEAGVVLGYEDGTFRPGDPITRGEAAAMFDRFEGTPGPQGPEGPRGPQGPQGPAGEDGVSGYTAGGVEVVLPARQTLTRTTACPEGTVALGGGPKIDNPDIVQVGSNMPDEWTKSEEGIWYPHAWTVVFKNVGDTKTNVTTFVTCAAVN